MEHESKKEFKFLRKKGLIKNISVLVGAVGVIILTIIGVGQNKDKKVTDVKDLLLTQQIISPEDEVEISNVSPRVWEVVKNKKETIKMTIITETEALREAAKSDIDAMAGETTIFFPGDIEKMKATRSYSE